ncbi:MAG: transporter substrate-binding domain-containing protein [Gemmatimonadetes bacterium]|nr:transporter substrate-binding domain-containing protein [Candidatus Palauibacter australiensis]
MKFKATVPMAKRPLLAGLALAGAGCGDTVEPQPSAACGDAPLTVAFYAFYPPVSYSADEDPNSPGFSRHMGYEADLLSALEAMPGTGFSFVRRPIADWPGIWLLPSTSSFDMAGGGITILESRTVDDAGTPAVAFTSGHITFRQSLLVRSEDAARLSSYDALTSAVRVGVLPGTTGEARLLQITGIVDGSGVLRAGTRVETPAGTVVADGTGTYTITPAMASPVLQGRTRLHPPSDDMPEVVYLGRESGETELFDALRDGRIDAVASGEIRGGEAAHTSGGAFVVAGRDSLVEFGGFTLDAEDRDLLACVDARIDWLTDERRTGFADWLANPSVFRQRAALWPGG